MKYGFYFILAFGLIIGAYNAAQNKIEKPLHLNSLKLGMSSSDVDKVFGSPSAANRNQYIYILQDGSELTVTLRDEKVSSAKVKFHRTVKIQDPDMKKLTLVQMDDHDIESNSPTWFYAGKPEEGLIYKITSEGVIEGITWVPPFTYGTTERKQLSALLHDFQSKRSL